MKKLGLALTLVLGILFSGCGGGSSPSITVAVSPATFTVLEGKTQAFTAALTNDTGAKGVNWTVTCSVSSCGTLSGATTTSVTYTAPGPVASNLTVTLTATSVADATKKGTATITVPAIAVAVAAASTTVNAGSSTQITPTVTNDPSATISVTWTLTGTGCTGAACGSVSPSSTASGTATTYTAPTTAPTSSFTVTITATSATDTSKSASVTITVPAVSVSVAPSAPTVLEGQTKQFTATVNGTSNQNVTWTVTCGVATCGSLSSNTSNPTTYTAPGPPASTLTVTITATSVADPTKSMSTNINVPAITVAVAPNAASVVVSTTQNFTATVANDPANGGVTWALSGAGCTGATCGTLSSASSASGTPVTYTAPATVPSPATVTLTATSVTDTTKSGTATITVTLTAACASGGSESLLSGQYAFLLKGFDGSGNPALVGGVLTFNGTNNNGLITAGAVDMNLNSGVQTNLTVTSGSYGVTSDHRGCMVITTSAGTQNYRFSLGNISGGVASTGHVIDFDTAGPFTTGILRKQNSAAFSTAQVTGNYAFGVSSIQNAAPAVGGGKFGAVGVLNLAAGVVSGGQVDFNQNGQLDGNSANTTWPANSVAINAGGSYTVSGTNGRGTLTFTPSGASAAVNAITYVVSSTDMLVLNSDPQTTNNIFAGEALQQSGTPFSANPLSGAYVGYNSGVDSTTGPSRVTVLLINASGTGISGTQLQNDAGTFASQSLTGITYSVTSSGRMTITGGGNNPPIFYLASASQAFFLGAGSSTESGFFQSQTGGPFSNSSASGVYAFGTLDPQVANASDGSGVANFASPNVNVTQDQNSNGTLNLGQTQSMTYSIDSTGLGVIPSGCSVSVTPTTCQTIFFVISPTQAVVMDTTSGSPKVQLANQ
jgi:predicted nucleic acid binding AN1-type Zn finger protein